MVCGAPPCESGPRTSGVDLGKDPQLASSNGRLFYLARDNDLVFELDPACGTPRARFSVRQEGARGIANPHDVAAAPDGSLFIVLYNVPRLVIVAKDGSQEGAIDLSSYDPDGNPQADAIRRDDPWAVDLRTLGSSVRPPGRCLGWIFTSCPLAKIFTRRVSARTSTCVPIRLPGTEYSALVIST